MHHNRDSEPCSNTDFIQVYNLFSPLRFYIVSNFGWLSKIWVSSDPIGNWEFQERIKNIRVH